MLGGLSLVFSATTGLLDTLLLDNGYLTELRTGAAGGLAADLLAKREIEQALIVGSGGQADTSWKRCSGCASRGESSSTRGVGGGGGLRRGDGGSPGIEIAVSPELREAVTGSDLIVTTTSSRSPLIEAAWSTGRPHYRDGVRLPGQAGVGRGGARSRRSCRRRPPAAGSDAGRGSPRDRCWHLRLEESLVRTIAAGKAPVVRTTTRSPWPT